MKRLARFPEAILAYFIERRRMRNLVENDLLISARVSLPKWSSYLNDYEIHILFVPIVPAKDLEMNIEYDVSGLEKFLSSTSTQT
jgi:hypothetical protein